MLKWYFTKHTIDEVLLTLNILCLVLPTASCSDQLIPIFRMSYNETNFLTLVRQTESALENKTIMSIKRQLNEIKKKNEIMTLFKMGYSGTNFLALVQEWAHIRQSDDNDHKKQFNEIKKNIDWFFYVC